MNWGKGLIVAMALFMSFILYMIINMMMHKVDLESEDYYSKELNYQQEIQAMENSSKLDKQIELKNQDDFLVVQIPNEGDFSNVKVNFIRPDSKKLDKEFNIEGTKSYLIPKKELQKGKYKVEITYVSDKKSCMQKEEVTI